MSNYSEAARESRERRAKTENVRVRLPEDPEWGDGLVIEATSNGTQYVTLGLSEAMVEKLLPLLQEWLDQRDS